MPCRMKFDFVDAMAVAVKRTKQRRVSIGVKAELDCGRIAKRLAQRHELGLGPCRIFAHYRFTQYAICLQEIVRLKRWRLVRDLVHRASSILALANPHHDTVATYRGAWSAETTLANFS